MNVIDNVAEPNDSQLVPNDPPLVGAVTGTSSTSTAPSYAVAEEDRHYADTVLRIDPLNEVPTPHQIPDGWTMPALRVEALPPETQREVRERLASVPPEQRAAKEAEFAADAIRGMRANLRVLTGVGSDAYPYHREMVAIASDCRLIVRDCARIQEELDEVAGHRTKVDPETGKAEAVPVMAVQGPRRAALEAQQRDLIRRYCLLTNEDGTPGPEASQRLQRALYESVQLLKQRDEAIAEKAEVERQTKEQIRAERIASKVSARVRMARSTV